VPALLLALLLAVQTGLLAHVHVDHLQHTDCLQCQADANPAALATPGALPPVAPARSLPRRALFQAPAPTPFPPSARGPPSIPC
jgi:hypothetical protein